MQAKLKHIILACSNAGELAMQQAFLGSLQASVSITVAASGKELEAMLGRHLPDVIIVLRAENGKNTDDNFLRVIRKNDGLDEIPVFVYTITPGKKDLGDWLRKWKNMLTYFS